MSMELGPYTNFHELNLDWFLNEFNKVLAEWAAMNKSFSDLNDAFNNLHDYVSNYFKNLNVQNEIDNKLNSMAADGSLYEIIRKYTDPIVNEQDAKITVLENRMNTFSSLPDGSTTGDAELIDIRVPADGFNRNSTYPSAGDAVRGQISSLKRDFDKVATIGNNVISSASFSDNYQVSNAGGLAVKNGYTVCEFDAIKGQLYTVAKVENTYLSIKNMVTTWAADFASKYEWASYDAESKTLTFTIPLDSNSNGHVMLSMLMENKESAYIAEGNGLKRTEIICDVPYIDEQISDIYSQIKSSGDKYTILCYGDSLTMGSGGNGTTYPSVLQTLLGDSYAVKNYGVGGETGQQIACRQGGVPMMVQPLECPYNTWVEISFKSIFGFEPQNLFVYQSIAGFNPCTIDGKNVELHWNSDNKQTVKNNESETLSVTRPTKIIPYSSTLKNKTCLIWIGTNGWGDNSIETLINTIKCMIEYNGNDHYIVIGLHTDSLSSKFAELETKMVQSFGEHFINIRKYLVNYGLSDANITPTSDDTSRISRGLVPSSLLSDGLHFNASGYTVIANVVYKTGKDLGLW